MDQPRTLTWVSRSVLALVVVGAVTALLAVLLRDDLVAAWSADHPPDSSIQPPAFVPVAIVLFVVLGGLSLILLAFVLGGHPWARHTLTALVGFVALATLAGLRTGLPGPFVACSVVGLGVVAATVFFLWHRDTSAYLRSGRGRVPTEAGPRS